MVHTKTVGFQAPPIGAPIAPTDVLSTWVKVNVIKVVRGNQEPKKAVFFP